MEESINDELLVRYLTETVSAEENGQMEQWCAMSAENQKTLEQLYFALQASDRLRVMKSVNHNKALLKLKDRIQREEKATRRRMVFLHLQRIAAALLLPVLAVSVWLLLQTDEAPVQYVELRSNPGMVASFELPDGSKVWLNGGSSLRYPTVFNGSNREVRMSGQGYFEIAHNARQPFSVRTGESFSLEVLGTSFNIAAYDDENIIETTLVEGSIRLKLLQDGKMVQRMMKPNEKIIYVKNEESIETTTVVPQNEQKANVATNDTKPESVKVAVVDPQYDIAWKDNRLLFRNHPMEEVIRTLGRYFNVQFVVKNEKVMESEITGNFSNEQLPQVMEYLKISSGIKFNIVPATVKDDEMLPGVVEIWK
jgi:ferric-dicitrate binding protein FerR (iron transport regulator)